MYRPTHFFLEKILLFEGDFDMILDCMVKLVYKAQTCSALLLFCSWIDSLIQSRISLKAIRKSLGFMSEGCHFTPNELITPWNLQGLDTRLSNI